MNSGAGIDTCDFGCDPRGVSGIVECMATTVDRRAHRNSVTPPIDSVVSELRGHLGATLVAYIGNVNETRAVRQWAEGARLPSSGAEQRLRTAHQVIGILLRREGDRVVQAWMQGMNPELGDVSPARVLRDDDLDKVGPKLLAAARQFIAG